MKNINYKKIFSYTLFGIVGILIGWFIKPSDSSVSQHDKSAHTEEQTWTCSMHPQIRQNEPGKCPICGMDLVPLSNVSSDEQSVIMSENAMRLANVQTMKVSAKSPSREMNLFGRIKPDERRLHSQTSHIPGRIEELLVNFTGETVSKNQVLAYIYSPDLVTTQEELIETYKIRDTQPELYLAARERLKNWKLNDEQIDRIIAEGSHIDRFPVLSDVNGIIIKRMVSNGDHIMTGEALFEVANLAKVWVQLEVYEKDLPWVKVGNEVEIELESLPGEKFNGKITFIDPVINPSTRVAYARMELNNLGMKLKPEMLVSGKLNSNLSTSSNELVIPKSAVMWTGERSIVYIRTATPGGDSFSLKEVMLGPTVGNGFIIKSGLKEGDEIAINGTFAIDAAAQLEGKTSMMNPIAKPVNHVPETSMVSPGQTSGSVKQETKDEIFSFLADYLLLKDNLVLGDKKKSKEHLTKMKSKIEKVSMSGFTGEKHDIWMNFQRESAKIINEMQKEEDFEKIRLAFKPLSAQIILVAETFGPFKTTLYVQNCPMADDFTGGDWLSTESVIRNPYFGDAMLTCGSVTRTISNQ